jgi:signal transduction histidine kinase
VAEVAVTPRLRDRSRGRARFARVADDGGAPEPYARIVLSKLSPTQRDAVLSAAFTAAALFEVAARNLQPSATLVLWALVVPTTLISRLRRPVPVLVANLVLVVLGTRIAERDDYPVALGLVSLVAIYTAAAHTRGRARSVSDALVVAAVIADAAAAQRDWSNTTNLVAALISLTILFRGAWLAGELVQRRRDTAVEREQRTRAALRDERARIARELHDVLAHAISVIVLQARGARHSLATEPEEALAAVDAVERTASQALIEMRRLLDVLRADDGTGGFAPQPSLAHLDALVGEVRMAGLPVDLHVDGEPRELPPGVDLCAYRIIQEALTNTLKHAGPATARVLLGYTGDELAVEVSDTGSGAATTAAGLGLTGMRERVAVFGGRLESGPGPRGGYVVKARLPL